MRQIEIFQNLPTHHLIPPKIENAYQNGIAREQAVLTITARFGLSSKSVVQDALGLSREAVNKLISKMRKRNLILTQRTFGNTDNQFYILSSEGIRQAEFLLNTELQLKADLSRVNERNLIHDLCTQLVILDLIKSKKVEKIVTERELRLCLDHKGNDKRIVDALVLKSDVWVAIEMETGNSKNKQKQEIRKPILDKYLQQIELDDGLYQQVYLHSHRQRFLTQIEKANKQLIELPSNNFSSIQQELVKSRLHYKSAHCVKLFELLYNSERKLTDNNAHKIDKQIYLSKLGELEEIVSNSDDRVMELRLAGFREAGELLGIK
jgi:hypothetical protein